MRSNGLRVVLGTAILLLAAAAARGDEPRPLLRTPLAEAFGSAPLMWGARLSPDGTKISFLQMRPDGVAIVQVFDTASGAVSTPLAGRAETYDIGWCAWANDERLLCGLRFIEQAGSTLFASTRLAAVNADGSAPVILLQDALEGRLAQFQDTVVDWLPDDPEHVLVRLPSGPERRVNRTSFGFRTTVSPGGSSVGRLNIYGNEVVSEMSRGDAATSWITDGRGTPRVYAAVTETYRRWHVRGREGGWSVLHEAALDDLDDAFSPVGFDPERNEVLYFDVHDGRTALFGLELDNDRAARLIYAHPRVDVAGVHRIGKHDRIVGVAYVEERPALEFFDARIERVHDMLAQEVGDGTINVIDEDWAARNYLVFVNGDRDPGMYYVFDTQALALKRIARAYPALAGRELASMRPVSYAAADGTEIPSYLTLPAGGPTGAAVVLPHGGPSSRDYWRFNFLVQYLAAEGYAVLQSNYRGSAGYGVEWAGDGGFQEWRRAVGDIGDGARYLVESGIADPGRICVVGWSYGGYAALLSAIEHGPRYRCVASIAGVTDPRRLADRAARFRGGRAAQAFIGRGREVRKAGSPLERAAEIDLPTLLVHGAQDLNVPFDQSERLHRAMARRDKHVELVEYEKAEHDIRPERYRIDLLARLGAFLDAHIGPEGPRPGGPAP